MPKLDTVYFMYIYVSFFHDLFYMSDNCLTYGVLFCRAESLVVVSFNESWYVSLF